MCKWPIYGGNYRNSATSNATIEIYKPIIFYKVLIFVKNTNPVFYGDFEIHMVRAPSEGSHKQALITMLSFCHANLVIICARLVEICKFFIKFNAFLHFWRSFWKTKGHWGHKFYLFINVLSITISRKTQYLVKRWFPFT